MLLVEVDLGEAYRFTKKKQPVCIGVGIFAKNFIPKGTEVYTEGMFSQEFCTEDFLKIPKAKVDFINKYATYDKTTEKWHLCTDDARNWNHSDDANCRYPSEESLTMIAVRDIKAGEELTCDYREFCDNYKEGFDFEIL